jgi:hypothetical protein
MFTRSTLGRLALATSFGVVAATGTILAARAGTLDAKGVSAAAPADKWLTGIKAKHKQFFDSPAPLGGIPLIHILNYYDTYNKAYNVQDKDIDAVLTFYGATTFYALNDAAWAKYRIGEFLDTKDASGQFATANPWRTAPHILGAPLPQASIEALQKRGMTGILCNNAFTIFAGMLAAKRGLDADVVYQDLKANILPGVELIPGMVVAIEQAARAGMSYQRQ